MKPTFFQRLFEQGSVLSPESMGIEPRQNREGNHKSNDSTWPKTALGRGLYQLADAEMDAQATLAEVSKLAPNSIICLVSALAFHNLTDQIPRKIWIAVGARDWAPKISYPPIRTVRFREPYFSAAIETHKICSVDVPIYSPAKSIADAFRNPKLVDRSVAIESLKSALVDRKATPAELFKAAREFGAANKIKPYLEVLTATG